MRYKSLRNILILILIVASVALNIKNIGRYFYPIKYSNYIYKYSEKYNLDPYFVIAVIRTESNFDANAKSNKNAYGIMQITASTGEWSAKQMGINNFSTTNLYDPEYNINMGCWYLGNLKQEFGSLDLVSAAYNAGRGNVNKWLNNSKHSSDGKNLIYIPFKETDKYVKRIRVYYNVYKWLYSK
jgi:soluble lytic murein transglycosylase